MFEEGQLYSPVTAGDDGAVTVHLAHDHPGANDPAYRARRNEIAAAALAWQPGQPSPRIRYADSEQEVWRTVCRELFPKYDRYAINEFREGVARLGLPRDHVPNLDEVSELLEPLTGFRYLPAAARRAPPPPPPRGPRGARGPSPAPAPSPPRAWSRCASSPAPCATACSTPPSTSATPPSRSTPPSPTSSTRSSATGTCSPRRASRPSSRPPATPPAASRPTPGCSSSPTSSGSRSSSAWSGRRAS